MKKHESCVIGKKIKHPNRIINKLSKGKPVHSVYLVLIPETSGRPEIISSTLVNKNYLKIIDSCVLCLVKNESEALEYIRRFTEISYRKYNDFLPEKVLSELSPEDIKFLSDLKEEEE